jgi:membrane-associated phospholipid phosphatase
MCGEIKMDIVFKYIKENLTIIKKHIIFLLIAIVFVLLSVFFIDIPLARYFDNIDVKIKEISTIITKIGSFRYIALFNIFAFIYFFLKKNKVKIFLIIQSVVIQIVPALIVQLLKIIFGRMRPYYFLENNFKHTFTFLTFNSNLMSFPSGHSAGIWGFVICMLFVFKENRYSKLLILLGIIIPLTRLTLNVHFLSDIVLGSIISILVCFHLMKIII